MVGVGEERADEGAHLQKYDCVGQHGFLRNYKRLDIAGGSLCGWREIRGKTIHE